MMAKRASRSDETLNRRMEREAIQGQARGELIVKLREKPFAIFEREMLQLEKRLIGMCPSKSEREEFHRRIAEDIYFGAINRKCSWRDLSKALQRLRRIGFGDVERRVFAAGHFVMWARQNQVRVDEAWAMLRDAERRALSLPRSSSQRENISRFIARIRSEQEGPRTPVP
jgi:hypothetical protein